MRKYECIYALLMVRCKSLSADGTTYEALELPPEVLFLISVCLLSEEGVRRTNEKVEEQEKEKEPPVRARQQVASRESPATRRCACGEHVTGWLPWPLGDGGPVPLLYGPRRPSSFHLLDFLVPGVLQVFP